MRNNVPRYMIIMFFGVMLIFLVIQSVVSMTNYNDEWKKMSASAVQTEATITDIWTYRTRGSFSVNVSIKYEDKDGNEYKNSLDRSLEGYDEGAVIPIYYDKNDPKKVMVEPKQYLEREKKSDVVLFILGTLLIAGGIAAKKYGYLS